MASPSRRHQRPPIQPREEDAAFNNNKSLGLSMSGNPLTLTRSMSGTQLSLTRAIRQARGSAGLTALGLVVVVAFVCLQLCRLSPWTEWRATAQSVARSDSGGWRSGVRRRVPLPPIKQGAHAPGWNPKSLRILVTGGSGFLGSHLVDRLMQQGHEVIVLDNLFTGSKDNVAQWLKHPRFEFVLADVTLPFHAEVDQIYHLACPASPLHYQYNPIKTFKTSFGGTYNMLELARKTNARMLFTSTSEVYGDPLVHPQDESYWGHVNPVGERSCYDEGKRVAETLIQEYSRQESLDIRVVRIFNTYGPRMALNDGRVVSNFVAQAIRGEKLTIQGSGNQTRSFCFVDDLIEGIIRTMNADAVEGPINLGNPREFTIKELAEHVQRIVGSSGVEHVPLNADDPQQRKPVIRKAKDYLNGWYPRVRLEDGLVPMIEDFRKRLKAEKH